MPEPIEIVLLIDAGNTRIKSARVVNGELRTLTPVIHTKSSALEVCQQLLEDQHATVLYVSSVLGVEFARSVKEYCHSLQMQVVFMQSTSHAFGLNNAYQTPENLGVDRFVAMLGALDLSLPSELIIVVDAGTAVTIDIMTKEGKHLGGIISPGLQTMFASLHKNTQLDQHSAINFNAYKGRYYADSTDDAIILGTVNTFIAGIEYTVEQTIKQLSSDVSIILTGGDAELITEGLSLDCEIHPDLVLRGLQKVYNHEQTLIHV
ncbi:MAG: Pantothenate kinase type III, CoaX-like (EC [uncultured Thiotrichaceae bacterium]|uniref:Type III pantothenate kinase n=1 Tax=uncultured Thiotrichaceae bacterium TaxID=298394 RepID=A0A6S6UI66_9GAMM|nr:MAG: Pantothenate kinase type III, CoaX-like (EC [uncultured Thiotrichaceae bacterium]